MKASATPKPRSAAKRARSGPHQVVKQHERRPTRTRTLSDVADGAGPDGRLSGPSEPIVQRDPVPESASPAAARSCSPCLCRAPRNELPAEREQRRAARRTDVLSDRRRNLIKRTEKTRQRMHRLVNATPSLGVTCRVLRDRRACARLDRSRGRETAVRQSSSRTVGIYVRRDHSMPMIPSSANHRPAAASRRRCQCGARNPGRELDRAETGRRSSSALDDEHASAGACQHRRRDEPVRAGADDDRVEAAGHAVRRRGSRARRAGPTRP